jgi:Protein of unknown function (DUF2934)
LVRQRLVIRLIPFRRRRINNPSQGPQELEQFSGSIVCLRERAVDPKQIVLHLLTTADKYRQFAQWIGDHETVRRILALTDELKQRARAMAKPEEAKIRNRAREIWEETGRPAGRDEEFWFQAEREFREAEDLAKRSGENV